MKQQPLDAPEVTPTSHDHFSIAVRCAKSLGICLFLFFLYVLARVFNLFDVLSVFGFSTFLLLFVALIFFSTFGLVATINSYRNNEPAPRTRVWFLLLHLGVAGFSIFFTLAGVHFLFYAGY